MEDQIKILRRCVILGEGYATTEERLNAMSEELFSELTRVEPQPNLNGENRLIRAYTNGFEYVRNGSETELDLRNHPTSYHEGARKLLELLGVTIPQGKDISPIDKRIFLEERILESICDSTRTFHRALVLSRRYLYL